MTPDTPVLPLIYTAAYTGPWDLVAPIPDLVGSFDASCKFRDGTRRFMRLGSSLQADLSESAIVFTSYKSASCGADSLIHARVAKHNDNGCLELTAPTTSTCFETLGSVKTISVLQGGSGYAAGNLVIVSGTGTGLAGTCQVDAAGRVTGVTITAAGSGYTDNTVVDCPSLCQAATCGTSYTPGKGAAFAVDVDDITFAVAGGQWHSSTGSLKMRIRTSLTPETAKTVKFRIKNSHKAQTGVNATILAGGTMRGSLPIQSRMLEGRDIMHISKRTTAVTQVCQSTAGVFDCSVTGAFSRIKTGLRSYSLKAERQCNTNVTNVSVKLNDIPVGKLADISKDVCVDSCAKYQLLFEYLDIASVVANYAGSPLKLDVAATNAGTTGDHCGPSGLRVVFTIEYDEDDVAPAQTVVA
jgi:hypothetical protein